MPQRTRVVDLDDVDNVHWSLKLTCGRELILDKLIQSRTYAGLLEGTPNNGSNDRTIEWLLDRARKDSDTLGEPYLVAPARRDCLREKGHMASVAERKIKRPEQFRHMPEWLPNIECIGFFRSLSPARDTTKDASSLTVVWFQDDFGFCQRAIQDLLVVDWNQHAVDWEY